MKKVLILLANGVEPLEFAAFTDVLGWANLVGNVPIQVNNAGLHERIETTFGLSICPEFLITQLDLSKYDALVIPGGFEPSGFYVDSLSDEFLNAIQLFDSSERIVAGVCVSSICLGKAGILTGRKATTYHQLGGKRKAQLESTGALFTDLPVVIDKNIITSSGPGTAIEVAFSLLEMLTNHQNAEFVRKKMRVPTPDSIWFKQPQVVEAA
jgi:4-methyl-5(b-hydroxyethyl)-thiazole monophosphate biosynthesis